MADTMRALVFTAPGALEWQRVPVPERAPGEVLVRVERLGICGTDVRLHDGTLGYFGSGLTRYPLRPGHEWSGIVVACDEGDPRVHEGDRVVGEPFLSCGDCALCRGGRRDQCLARDEIGVRGATPGAAAEYLSLPAANVAVVPAGVGPTSAVLAEPLVTVLNALSSVRLTAGESLGVIGAGTLGLLAAQVARAAGAEVTVYARSDRSARAAASGASFTRVDAATDGAHDAVVEAAGGATALALRIAAPTGRIALIGVAGAAEAIEASVIITKGLELVGVLGGIPFLERAVRLLAAGVVRPDAIVDRVLPFGRAEEALDLVASGRTLLPKVVLDVGAIDSPEKAADPARTRTPHADH